MWKGFRHRRDDSNRHHHNNHDRGKTVCDDVLEVGDDVLRENRHRDDYLDRESLHRIRHHLVPLNRLKNLRVSHRHHQGLLNLRRIRHRVNRLLDLP